MNQQATRRAFVGALAAAPVAVAIAGAPAFAATKTSSPAWDKALADYRRAERAMNDYHRDRVIPADKAWSAVRDQWGMHHDFSRDPVARAALDKQSVTYDPIEKHFDELVDLHTEATGRLMRTTAPDMGALAVKLGIFKEHEVHELTFHADDAIETLHADALRLASERRC